MFGGRRRELARAQTAVARAADVWERAGRQSAAVPPTLVEIEATALKVYGDHGLPTKAGHYRRGPDGGGWDYLGETVETERRWAMVLEKPTEAGWKYATLEDIGRFDGAAPDLRAAAALLASCRHLKSRLMGREAGDIGDDIERAVRLGADWQRLQAALSWKESSRLKLTTPIEGEAEPSVIAMPGPDAAPKPKPKRVRKKKPAAPKAAE